MISRAWIVSDPSMLVIISPMMREVMMPARITRPPITGTSGLSFLYMSLTTMFWSKAFFMNLGV